MRTIYIDSEQIEAIRRNMKPRDWVLLWLCAETGMRIGDAVALRRFQIGRSSILYRAHKTGKGTRVRISAELREALLALSDPKRNTFIFQSPSKPQAHLTRQAAWSRVKRACARAGIDSRGVAPHSFRKHFAVEVFKRDGLKAAQAALQHDSAITTEIYALSDFSTGKNATKPLLRRDLQMIVELCVAALGNRKAEK